MSDVRVHTRNLLANWVGHGANLVVMFFLSPFIVHTLGETEYGIWSLLMVLTGYMGVFDLGVRASTGRYIILYLGQGNRQAVNETIRSGLGLFSVVGLLMLAAGGVLGWLFPTFFASAPPEYHRTVMVLLPLLAVNVWMGAVGAVFSSVLVAHGRFDLTRGVDLAVLALRTVGTLLALNWGYGILGLTAVTLACSAVGWVGNHVLACRVHPDLQVWPLALVRARLKELFNYGAGAFIATVADKIIGQTSLVVVGALISVAAVTVFSVGAMLVYYSASFLGLIQTTFFPAVQKAAARNDLESVRWYYLRQVRLSLICGLPVYIGFIVFGREFIGLWMGGEKFPESSVREAALVMAILSAAKLAGLLTLGAHSVILAVGKVWFNAVVTMIEAAVNLGLAILFVKALDGGLAGVAAGTLAAALLVSTLLLPAKAMRESGMRLWTFLKVALWGVAAALATAAWFYAARTLIPGHTWGLFALQVAASLVGYAPLALLLLVMRDDRTRLLRVLGLGRTTPPGPPGPPAPPTAPRKGDVECLQADSRNSTK